MGWIARISDEAIFWGLAIFALLYPLLVNPFFAPVFGLIKLTFLRILVIFLLFAWSSRALAEGELKLVRSPINLPVLVFWGLLFWLRFFPSIH